MAVFDSVVGPSRPKIPLISDSLKLTSLDLSRNSNFASLSRRSFDRSIRFSRFAAQVVRVAASLRGD